MTESKAHTGFYSIHANRLEMLRDLVVKICSTQPLAPLQNEMCLVQSNGIAQWLKLGLAQPPERGGLGIAAGFNFSLPSTFIWRAYRSVLSSEAVPDQSSLDKDILVWRLYRLLNNFDELEQKTSLLSDGAAAKHLAPLKKFLTGDNPDLRRFQLAQRISLLFDQYQVYRADWLAAWEAGRDVIYKRSGEQVIAKELLWQPVLWRLLLNDAGESHASSSRASVHQRFMEKAKQLDAPLHPELLPKRIIVFGISALPQQILEALQMISKFTKVVFCVANPCQYYWGDIVSERDVIISNKLAADKKLRIEKRQRSHNDEHQSLAELPLDELHQQANPILASLGKQGRDYIRLLEEFDGTYAEQNEDHIASDRLNVFVPYAEPNADGEVSLLNQIQNDIFDLTPIDELLSSERILRLGQDESLVFHEVHSEQRELEVLHDQLLAAFNNDSSLKPSEILVMTPDINKYAPHIHAVFGLFEKSDKRYIPFAISDQGLRDQDPNVIAFEHLLSLDKSRFTYTEVIRLLELPAIAEKFDLTELDLDVIKKWTQGANIRWGLNAKHREQFVPNAELHVSTWQAGLRSILLGYSMPKGGQWAGELAYDQVGGLEVKVIGNLIEFIDALEALKLVLEKEHYAHQWQKHILHILDTFFAESELSTLAIKTEIAKQSEKLLKHIEQAESAEQLLPIETVRDLILDGLDGASLNHRFLMGSVNFATLMPMRAIPFKRVYILGMNDGDFPRHNKPLDFDLMANDYRPGDRSMREDDRYLFLEALLAARESLYISWIGRSIKDDSERPPSLLVSQLKDYVNKFWRVPSNNNAQAMDNGVNSSAEILVSEAISCIHPLQAFSEQYFKASNPSIDGITQSPLFTYASEWRDAHTQRIARSNTEASNTNTSANSQSIVNRAANGIFEKAQSIPLIVPEQALNIEQLTRFMKKPVETFFKQALLVNFDTSESANNDRETFKPSALQQYSLESQLIENAILAADDENQAVQKIDAELRAMSMSGAMGLASSAAYLANELRSSMTSLASRYFYFRSALIALPQKRVEIDYRYDLDSATQLSIEAVVGNFTQARDGETRRVLISKSNTKGTENSDIMRFDNLLKPWLEHLVCHTRGEVFTTRVLAKEAKVSFVLAPLTSEQAKAYLNEILQVWTQGMQRPLPLESRAGFEFLYDINQLQQEMVTEQSAERDFNAALELDIASLKQKVTQAFEKRLENDKGYYRRAFGKNISIIDEREFQRLSEQLYLPLIRAVEEYDDEQY